MKAAELQSGLQPDNDGSQRGMTPELRAALVEVFAQALAADLRAFPTLPIQRTDERPERLQLVAGRESEPCDDPSESYHAITSSHPPDTRHRTRRRAVGHQG